MAIPYNGRASHNKTGYKGVSARINPANGAAYFVTTIRVEGRTKYVGTYSTALEAAHAYDKAAVERYGDFAWVNFSDLSVGV